MLVALFLAVALLGCRGGRKAGGPNRPPAPPARGLAASPPQLVRAVRAVLADCQLGDDGQLVACGSNAEHGLAAAERGAGPAESFRTYCRALEEDSAPLRRLGAARLSRLSFPGLLHRLATRALLDCLLSGLVRVEPAARPGLARAAALVATRVGGEDKLLAAIKSSPVATRAAALQALWANGRLGELPRLEQLLAAERDTAARTALIRGFAEGGPLSAGEQDKVCALLRAQLTAKDSALASAAASTDAAACPDDGDQILAAAEQMAARRALDAEVLTAVRAVNGFLGRRGTAEQRKRSRTLLTLLCRDSSLDAVLRAAALEHLAAIDRPAAVKEAQRLAKEIGPTPRRLHAISASAPAMQSIMSLRERIELLLEKH